MNIEVMCNALHQSEAGNYTFPQVLQDLASAGVESYFVDLIRGVDTFYLPGGQTHVEPLTLPLHPVAETLSESGIVAAIRAAQTDQVRYPEFLRRAAAAGAAAYWVFLTGRKAIYFGRNGAHHTELFPTQP